jgi:hypothetical protein
METDYSLEAVVTASMMERRERSSRGDQGDSGSFSNHAHASMDLDRHRSTTFHSRERKSFQLDGSYCDGLGESMFGESFALDDGPNFDIESHQQLQWRAASHGTTPQLSPVIDEEGP